MSPIYTTPIAKNRFSQERFPLALKGLMDERHLSYRQLAYKTKLSAGYLNHLTKGTRPVPADPVIAVIAGALCVEADFFLEFRLRQIAHVLDGAPTLADKLYAILLRNQPVPDDIRESLSRPRNGKSVDGGNGGSGGSGGSGRAGSGGGVGTGGSGGNVGTGGSGGNVGTGGSGGNVGTGGSGTSDPPRAAAGF